MTTIFEKVYQGFETLNDLGEDVAYAFDPRFNSLASIIPNEFTGKVTVTIQYEEVEEE